MAKITLLLKHDDTKRSCREPFEGAAKARELREMVMRYAADGIEDRADVNLAAALREAVEAERKETCAAWVKDLRRQYRLADHIGDMDDPTETSKRILAARGEVAK